MSALPVLRERLEAEGHPLSDGLIDEYAPLGVFERLLAAGQRTAADAERYSVALESALEGYLVHYGSGRLLDPGDADMRLLAGDYLYAVGFLELARAGDVDAIEDLADLIAVCAALHSVPDGPRAQQIAAVWALSALSIGTGRWLGFEPAKQALVATGGDDGSSGVAAAVERARDVGLTLELEAALIAFRGAAAGRLRDT